jgi:hypothetical protein
LPVNEVHVNPFVFAFAFCDEPKSKRVKGIIPLAPGRVCEALKQIEHDSYLLMLFFPVSFSRVSSR